MNYKIILHTLGWVLNIEGAALILPMICALIYREPYLPVYAVCIALCLGAGLLLTVRSPKNKEIYAKEGYVTVALAWILLSVFGALPFFISGFIPNFFDAVFETVSGFTTTGASILTDVEALPKSLIFWRSFTHWLGGMGVLVFLVAVVPLSGGSNMFLIKAESPGPSVSKLVPKVRQTAKILYIMYLVMTVIEIVLLLLGGLDMFSALTLSFGTAGTGGFAIKNSGCADYTPYVQNVITAFMMLFGIDFSLYYMILLRKFRSVLKSDELKAYLGFIICASLIISYNIYPIFGNAADSLRHAFFQVGSLITTTGYATTDFDLWPELSKTILIASMFAGACAGSTGGGIKFSRIVILLKSIVKEVRIAAHPKRTQKITMNGRPVEHYVVRAVNVYMAAYLVIFAVSLLIISIDNFDFATNFTAVLSAFNNIGPGFAKVGPTRNFSIYSNLSTLVLTFDMLIGRLEIFPILVLFSPYTWRK